jgi:hypothetical protein
VDRTHLLQSQRSRYFFSTRATLAKHLAALAPVALIAVTSGLTAVAQETERDLDYGDRPVRTGPIKQAEDPSGPRRHFRLKNPALLSGEDAERLYTELKSDMATRYELSGQPGVANYQTWMRYNRVPYPSVSHGNRYLSNYGNPAAAAYGRFEQAGRLPVGSILAKDSITMSKDGQAMPGALFLMEKMESGFNYVSGDWRYTMIMPDGSLFGTTNGEGTERVRFCISCHLAVEQQDHLFFIPEEYRQN